MIIDLWQVLVVKPECETLEDKERARRNEQNARHLELSHIIQNFDLTIPEAMQQIGPPEHVPVESYDFTMLEV